MERPASVTVIAALFFLVAAYLVVIGIVEFVAPGALATTRAAGITYGRELERTANGYICWCRMGAGRLGILSAAELGAVVRVVLMVIGIAGSVPAVSAAARDLTWRFFWYGAQVMVRVVIVWYLVASPELIEAFGRK